VFLISYWNWGCLYFEFPIGIGDVCVFIYNWKLEIFVFLIPVEKWEYLYFKFLAKQPVAPKHLTKQSTSQS
jgi:hypothetical protein